MPWLDKVDGGRQWVPDDQLQAAVDSELYVVPDGLQVTLKNERTGITSQTDLSNAERFLEGEERGETGDEAFARAERARIEQESGGLAGGARTLVEGAVNSASLNLYDAAGGAIFGDDFRTRRKEDKIANSGLDTAAEIGGYLLPTGLAKAPGLIGKVAKYSPVGIAERLGARVSATGAGKGLVGAATAKGAGFALEGGLVGAGETLGEYALATTELERERAAANLSSNVLFGAAVGGGLGAGSEVAIRGVRRAKKLADELGEKMAQRGQVSDDIAGLDKEGLRAVEATTREELGGEVLDGIRVSMDSHTDTMFKAFDGADKKVLADTRGVKGWITKHLDDPRGIVENPNSLAKSLRKEEELLRKTIDNHAASLAALKKSDDAAIRQIDDLLAKGSGNADDATIAIKGDVADLFGNVRGIKVSRKSGVKLSPERLAKFREELLAGAADEMRASAAAKLPAALADNLVLQSKIADIKSGNAPKLAEIRLARDALSTSPKQGFLSDAVTGAAFTAGAGVAGGVLPEEAGFLVPLAGAAMAGKIRNLVMGGLGKAGKKTAKHSADAVARFVDVGGKVMERTPPLATKVLAGMRYAEKTPPLPATLPRATLVREYKAREAEIYSQVTMGPTGLTMRPQARKKLADRLAGVRVASPELADSLETIANRKVSFLASKLPKRPDFLAHKPGPDDWHPGNDAIRAFARYMAAVEDPDGIEDRLADATITPQDVEAFKTVYPERYAALRNDIAARLPELQATLPIAKRMAFSIFTGLPVEPSMEPSIFQRIQAQFSEEQGTEGGTQAPAASPNFGPLGSTKSQEKTRAQKRAE